MSEEDTFEERIKRFVGGYEQAQALNEYLRREQKLGKGREKMIGKLGKLLRRATDLLYKLAVDPHSYKYIKERRVLLKDLEDAGFAEDTE